MRLKGIPITDSHMHMFDFTENPTDFSVPFKLLGRWPDFYRNLMNKLVPAPIKTFFGGNINNFAKNYRPSDYTQDAQSFPIKKTICVEALWNQRTPAGLVEESRWTLATFDKAQQQTGIECIGMVGHADLERDDFAQSLDLRMKALGSRFLGVRQQLAWSPSKRMLCGNPRGDLMQDPRWQRGLAELGERNLSFDIWVYHPQLKSIASIIEKFPKNRFVLCHMGTPYAFGGEFAGFGKSESERQEIRKEWEEGLAAVAAHKNVAVKISGCMPVLGFGFGRNGSTPSVSELAEKLGPLVSHTLKVFGAARCMFGTNFPVDKSCAPYADLIQAYAQLLSHLQEEELRGIFSTNAGAIYLKPRQAT